MGYAINASGQVTGALTTASVNGAFLYTNGTALNLGTPPGGSNSTGLAINATAHIVGSYLTSGGTIDHSFFYNGVMIDLNTVISAADPLQPYVTLTYAVGINDSGLILVNGTDSRTGNVIHGYLIQAPGIDIAPGTLSLPDTAVGTASATQSVTLTNHSVSAVALGAISVSGNFSQTNNCGSSLAPGSNCAVKVAFDPVSVGSKAGQLAIASGGASYVVALYGVAPITASITASATTLAVGQRLTLTWKASAGATCTASSSNPAFQGSVALSGSKALTETAAGTDYYGLHCTATGVPEVDPVTPAVVWTWPTVTTTVAASPTTIVMGQSTTLTWSATNATTCSASGGGANDGWAGTKATHGTQTVTEAYALATASVSLAFTITCSSSASGLSSMATAHVMENAQAAASSGKSGGGGSLDVLCLLVLSSVIVIRIMRSR